jgi:hypothetical protein
MPIGDENDSGVAVAPAALLGRGNQALDLIERKMLPRTQLSVWPAPSHASHNCLYFGGFGTTKPRYVFAAILALSSLAHAKRLDCL